MTKPGQPRKPKKSQGNRKGELRYEAEAETWNCTKCDQHFTIHAERRAATRRNAHQGREEEEEEATAGRTSITTRIRNADPR